MVGDLTSARRVEMMPGVDDGTTVMEEYYRYHDNPYRYHDNLENLLHSAVRVTNITLTNVNYADSQTPTTRATKRVRLGWTAQSNPRAASFLFQNVHVLELFFQLQKRSFNYKNTFYKSRFCNCAGVWGYESLVKRDSGHS